MSGIGLQYTVHNVMPKQMFRRLEGADTFALMAEIGEFQLSQTLLNFQNTQTPDGDLWDESGRAKSEGGKTLTDRGHLRDSYTYNVNGSGDEVEIGSNMIYAAIHHHGGVIEAKDDGHLHFKVGDRWVKKRKVEIPARPALGLNDESREGIDEIVQDFYQELIRG